MDAELLERPIDRQVGQIVALAGAGGGRHDARVRGGRNRPA
jgi:hypothetical protein